MRSLLATASVGAIALTALLVPDPAAAQSLRWWTTENQPARIARQEALAAEYEAATGVSVAVIPVEESDLGARVTAAFGAGDLPDVIQLSSNFLLPWAEAGILDIDAATEVVDDLGRETFASGAVSLASVDGGLGAVPTDGWTQLIVYRKDLFEAAGLAPPTTYEAMRTAAETLHNPPELYGFVQATKVDESYMEQMIETLFNANGASPFNAAQGVGFDHDSTIQALDFYKALAEVSPPGELYWKQARELYFSGEAAMIVWSPFILDELAGLRDSAPPTINDDPTSRDLASKTGFVTSLAGPSNPTGAAWAQLQFLGITTDADTDAAIDFVKFALSDGYGEILGIAPEGKFPIRRGTKDDPTKFIDLWNSLDVGVDRRAPLSALYPPDVIASIVAGLETADRWGVKEGKLAQASKIINSRVLNRLVREYIDGERSAEDTFTLINQEIAKVVE